ncbi:MAG: hypothetical protein H6725_00135 [Sandaracinaceae bacterium]|nr:hypothetical protein [Sandaracinaceae bacterium]
MRHSPSATLAGATLALLLVPGCGGGGGPSGFDGVNVELPPPEAFAVTTGDACFVDSECSADTFCFQGDCLFECNSDSDCTGGDTCSPRRRCESGTRRSGGRPKSIDNVIPGVGIANAVATTYAIAPGQTFVNIVLEPTAPVIDGAIGYSLTRFDTVLNVVETDAQMRRAEGTTSFTIPVPTGVANPSSPQTGSVRVDIKTSIGDLSVSLLPQVATEGVYAGTVRVRELADAALPIDAEIVTSPEGATLATATTAWLLLPVRPDTLFAPHAPLVAGPDAVAAQLTFDGFTQRWVAVFDHSFGLAASGPFGGLADGQVERSLRFEIEVVDGHLIGQMSDRWSGLFDERTAVGVRSAGDVVFQGELDLTRVGDARAVANLPTPAALTTPNPQPREVPSLAACDTVNFGATSPINVGGTTYSCVGLPDTAAFTASTNREAQMGCAIAVGETALAGPTVARQIQGFVSGTTVGQSFSDFIDDCAAGTGGTCVPSPEILCARQLLAYAHQMNDTASTTVVQLVSTYRGTNREASLGPQLAAFHVDTQTRLDWLQAQNFPAIVTSAVQGLNETLLDDWQQNVLEVHLGVLADQFSAGSLAVLGRASDDAIVNDGRTLMLLELSQSWRASADALALAASRWSDLYQDVTSRTEKAAYVREKLFDLYVMSGVMAELNRLAGAGFASSSFAGGFSAVATELQELAQPFSALVFARDAEVVVSTSLDPTMGNDTVLAARRTAAMTDLTRAATSVTSTLTDLQRDLVDEATLRGRIQTQTNELYSELVDLCGLPNGCALNDRADPSCRPRVVPGLCGFALDPDTDERTSLVVLQPSEANAAVLAYYEALQDRDLAVAELEAGEDSARRFVQLTDAFAASVESWNTRRGEVDTAIGALVDEAQSRRQGALDALEQFVLDGIALREEAAAERGAWLQNWDAYEMAVDADVQTLLESARTSSTAAGLQVTADTFLIGADALIGASGADSTPGYVMAGIGAGLAGAGAAFNIAAGVTQANADWLAAEVDRNSLSRDFQMSRDDFQFNLETAAREDQLANLEAEMEALATSADFQDAILETIVDQLEGALADELAYERDLAEVDARRQEADDRLGELQALRIRVAQAQLTVQQKLLAYRQVIQRAELVNGQFLALEAQEAELNDLLGSPNVVFGWANRLTQAENRLERAKRAMMEWLVALEYLAVRPFVDQRIQILLARNTYQLEDIAAELDRLQGLCGGALNTTNVSVSVRNDLIGMTRGIVDASTLNELSAGDRFREMLAAGVVPIDKRVRYTADSNVGDLVTRDDILAVSFDINLTDFANLAATCNAKISSISVELVGEGLGSGRPTVSLLYDGASSVRSCQPNISAIVESIGRDATTFGPITTFRAAGRSVSPVAGINAPGGENTTLRGLPLASQYTLLIDPQIGENGSIDWARLDDVILHIVYVSQDVFPTGQCE